MIEVEILKTFNGDTEKDIALKIKTLLEGTQTKAKVEVKR